MKEGFHSCSVLCCRQIKFCDEIIHSWQDEIEHFIWISHASAEIDLSFASFSPQIPIGIIYNLQQVLLKSFVYLSSLQISPSEYVLHQIGRSIPLMQRQWLVYQIFLFSTNCNGPRISENQYVDYRVISLIVVEEREETEEIEYIKFALWTYAVL